jgi:Zn-dependent protease with chaperone function
MANPSPAELRRSFLKILVLPALTFLLVPLLALGFVRYGEAKIDRMILEGVSAAIDRDASLAADQRADAKAFFAAHPASKVCGDPAPELQRFRAAVCKTWSEPWQFVLADRIALVAAFLGLAALAGVVLLGLVAFWSRGAQYWSFMVGWRGLVAVTVVETILQGVLLVWLSYWMTALLFERYFPKLIILAAILAGGAVLVIVSAILRKVPAPDALEAETVTEGDAPALWARVRELATRVGTSPPATIAAGIDDNFFVTEHPLPVARGEVASGRLLYVSLPLLRALEPSEADAVLGHELAHYKGGDTAALARLAPMLVRYEAYSGALASAGALTAPAAAVMRLYRAIFQLALAREQRRRELLADAEAVRLTSAEDLGRALLKVTGYSSFRASTERELFARRSSHEGALSLGARIDGGLAAHAASPGFVEQVRTVEMPHPFDSHPPLEERIAAAGARTRLEDAAALLSTRPDRTWADEVRTSAEVEGRLWAEYERRFQESHDESLAWRFLPATDEERSHVLRYFPDRTFPLKDGGAVRVTYHEVVGADGVSLPFADLQEAKVVDGTFSKALVLTRRKDAPGERKMEVKLRPLGDAAEQFKAVVGQYWQRAQVARAAQEEVGPRP